MPTRRPPSPARLALVRLEDRHAPATFTVITTADNGDNNAPTAGSLREAILKANAAVGADQINFAITGAGVQTIAPPAPLPAVTDAVTINGASQTGFSGVPVVRLSGAAAGAGDGLALLNHSGSVVNALTVGGFTGAGVRFDGGGGHKLTGSLIGLAANGTAADGNGIGVLVTGKSAANIIGGASGARNVISGGKGDGVLVTAAAEGTVVIGNFLGTDLGGGSAVPNAGAGVAVADGAKGTLVGGFSAGDGNVIAGNTLQGVRVTGAATAGTTVAGNRIGRSFAGTPLGNGGDGVLAHNAAGTAPVGGVTASTGTAVRSNTIASNNGAGVAVRDTTRFVRIEGNEVYDNGGLGIAVDATANNGLTPPQITKIETGATADVVTGTAAGKPNTQYQVNFFSNSAADPSGSGEGKFLIANNVVLTTDGAGAGAFSFKAQTVTGNFITATVTAVNTGETSGFSNAAVIPGTIITTQLFAAGAGAGRGPSVAVYRADGAVAYTIPSVFDAGFTGGVRVAMADFDADGNPDLVAGTGPGIATRVRVISGADQKTELFAVAPFEAAFTGGVYVAAGDLNGDGTPDLVITPDEGGGPRCRVFSGKGFGQMADFFGIEDVNFRGGARPAVGDVSGDGVGDLVVAAGFGGGPRVAAFSGPSLSTGKPVKVFNDFFAFEQTLRNGVFIAAGDVTGDKFAEVIAGGGPGGGPRVTVFNGQSLNASSALVQVNNFFAGDEANRGGIRVAAQQLNSDTRVELLTGPGPGGGSKVNGYGGNALGSGTPPPVLLALEPFPGFTGGVYVG